MSQHIISGDVILFKNPFSDQDILLKHYHDNKGYKLKFDNVEFTTSADFTEVKIGDFVLKQEGNSLTIGKHDQTLMSIG